MLLRLLLNTLLWIFLFTTFNHAISTNTYMKPSSEEKESAAATRSTSTISTTTTLSTKSVKSQYIDPKKTLECHRREYTFTATRTDSFGRQCWQVIKSMSCWGRCDSTEIADWRFPYKKTYHPVCIMERRRTRRVRLRHCDPDAPRALRKYEYVDALSCSCAECDSSVASCEGVPFIGTRAP